jgi:hypothetical protein
MLEKSIICSGCKKMNYIKENEKTCDKCRQRTKAKRVEIKDKVVMCKKDGCKFKRFDEKGYCQKHQILLLLEDVETRNKRLCSNYVRGCREELEKNHKYSRCDKCLEKDRENDKSRREKVKIQIMEQKEEQKEEQIEKPCTICCKTLPVSMFQGVKSITKTCLTCRESCKKNDAKRDKEHRNEIARKNDTNPERIAAKEKWKEENYEKVAETWMKSREKQIQKLGVDEYQKINADNAKKWRENNPEKVLENNEERKKNLKFCYGNYVRTANYKNLEFMISYDEYENIVCSSCYYCGIISEKGFNGIDRKDQTQGYILENCVNCCQMCNYMKGSLCDNVFIKRIEHILTHNNLIENGNLYPNLFANHFSKNNYKIYKSRALKKNLNFEITNEQFKEITLKSCYICGKKMTEQHKNGIDRFDNNIGYTLDNCKPCCGECNYLKKNYTYNNFLEKCKLIYDNLPKTMLLNNSIENKFVTIGVKIVADSVTNENIDNNQKNIVRNINKKTKEEIRVAARIRKQEQRKKLVEKYGDEEYRKMHAQQIAENRKKKIKVSIQ